MKTAREVLERAMLLCGMTGPDGVIDRLRDADVVKQGMTLVWQIFADLYYLESPDGELPEILLAEAPLPLTTRTVNDVMPYGVAMLLAGNAGDVNNQTLYATIYNQKRRAVNTSVRTITDTMPTGEW